MNNIGGTELNTLALVVADYLYANISSESIGIYASFFTVLGELLQTYLDL